MHRRDGRAARAGRQPAAALALAAMLVLGHTACKETAPPVLVPAQPTYAEDSAAIIRLEDLRVLRDAADSPRDLTAIARRTDPRCGGARRSPSAASATWRAPGAGGAAWRSRAVCGSRPRSGWGCSATRRR